MRGATSSPAPRGPRREIAIAVALLATGVAARAVIVLAALQHAATWEESWTATVARALTFGDCSLFWDGPYAPWTWVSWGESLLGVPVVWLLGTSVAAWKVLPIGLWCAVAVLFWRVVRRYAGPPAGLLALALFVIGPPSLLHWSLFTTHGRITAWIGPLLFLLVAAPLVEGDVPQRALRFFLAGLLAGLSFVLHWDNAVPCGIGLVLLADVIRRNASRSPGIDAGRSLPLLAGGMALGVMPTVALLLVRGHAFGIYQQGFAVRSSGFLAALAHVPASIADSFVFWGMGGISGRTMGLVLLGLLAGLAGLGAAAVAASWRRGRVAGRRGLREGRRALEPPAGPPERGWGSERVVRRGPARRLRRFGLLLVVSELALFPILFAASGYGRARYFRSYFPPLLAAAGCGAAVLLARRGGRAREPRRRLLPAAGGAAFAAALLLEGAGAAQFLDRLSWGESLHYEYQDWRDGPARTLWEYGKVPRATPVARVPPEVADAWRETIERPDPRNLSRLSRLLDTLTDPLRAQALQDMGFAAGQRIVRGAIAGGRVEGQGDEGEGSEESSAAAEDALVTIALAMPVEDARGFLPWAGWILGKRWLEGADATGVMLRLRDRLPEDRAVAFVGGFLESSWEPDAKIPWTLLGPQEIARWFHRQRIEPREE